MWTKQVRFSVWPVGQGLFSQADIWIDRKMFRVVYDCGTFCTDPSISSASLASLGGRRVDLLVVSHFHWDHVSLIPELLKWAGEIREVWLPYLSPEQRVLLAVSAMIAGRDMGFDVGRVSEIAGLIAGGPQWFESRGAHVIEIGGEWPLGDERQEERDGVAPDGESPQDNDEPQERVETIQLRRLARAPSIFTSQSGFEGGRAAIEAHGRSRHVETPFELLTWCKPLPREEAEALRFGLEKWLSNAGLEVGDIELLTGQHGTPAPSVLERLVRTVGERTALTSARRIYSAASGAVNASSVCLLMHPADVTASSDVLSPGGFPWGFRILRESKNPALLWTGDSSGGILDELVAKAAGPLRQALYNIWAYQFPHHGSKSSVSSTWLRAVSWRRPWHPLAVISAGRHNRFGHPSAEALRACAPVVVSEGSAPFEAIMVLD